LFEIEIVGVKEYLSEKERKKKGRTFGWGKETDRLSDVIVLTLLIPFYFNCCVWQIEVGMTHPSNLIPSFPALGKTPVKGVIDSQLLEQLPASWLLRL